MSQGAACPNCGAPLDLAHRSIRVAACSSCDSLVAVEAQGVRLAGTNAHLSSFASMLSLGDVGTILGRSFSAVGRVRCEYKGGFWDEWYLIFEDGSVGWLQEDEGELALVQRERLHGTPPPPTIRPGETISVGGRAVYVRERGEGKVAGREGQLPSTLYDGQTFRYIDGIWEGRLVMLEISDDEIELFIGDEVDPDDLEVDGGGW